MIINEIRFENFGLYGGKQNIILSTNDKEKNIVLIGGKNGCGKTTLFEGIRLCFYGYRTHGGLKKEYHKYLRNHVHHGKNGSSINNASITVLFTHENLGKKDTYEITRSWTNNQETNESFSVIRNGLVLDEVEQDQWDHFINDMIPIGLSELFFFDGEKIQNLAEDKTDKTELSKSFKSLLGIDLIERLNSDLEIYMIKELKDKGAKGIKEKIEKFETKIFNKEKEAELLRQEKASIQNRLEYITLKIDSEENKIVKEGGLFSRKREKLKDELNRINKDIENFENKIKEYANDLLPFAFAIDLSKKLKNRLEYEVTIRENRIGYKKIKDTLSKFNNKLRTKKISDNINLSQKQINLINSNMLDLFEEEFGEHEDEFIFVHDISQNENKKLLELISKATTESKTNIIKWTSFLEKSHVRQQIIIKELQFAPPDETISPFLEKVKELNTEVGKLQSENSQKIEQIRKSEWELENIKRDLIKEKNRLFEKGDLDRRLKTVNKIKKVLQKYHSNIIEFRVEDFNKSFLTYFNKIARKKNIFTNVELNKNDYSVTLFKEDNKKIQKSQLSAGEKQIYAVAVIWTLTKLSRRSLPFIIDTPLGRLDSDHRETLINNFFPKASKQVIILSTDTEIDKKYMDQLKPHINKCYHLDYNDDHTIIKEGYFW
ncbi:DNA sulfur modification protein DndD [archaeon]|nr:DNA sulfur modification protein DndD [archaeon]